METRANYVLLGGFTILMAAAAMLFALWIAQAQFNQAYALYDVVFQGPVRGLAKGGEVRFNGIKIGEITELKIDEENSQQVVARVRVDAATPVRISSEASLEALGLTGVNLIQLTAGNTADPLLRYRPGRPPPRLKAKTGALDDLVAAGQDIAQRANEALASLQEVLTKENVAHISNTLANLDAASAQLAQKDGAIKNVGDAAKSIAQLSEEARGKLNKLDGAIDSIDHAASSVADAADNAKGFIATAQDAADTAAYQTLPEISNAARDLRRLSVSLQQLSGDVESGNVGILPGSSTKPMIKVDQ
jgi:phospholipid/cholesterol/gamma-HCH transport system substrate-binding protein